MMYEIKYTSQFKRDVKLAQKRGYKMELLQKTIALLASGEELPEQYHDHALIGNFSGHRECHIQPDWLLVYRIVEDQILLELVRTGTHSDLFK